MGWQALDDLCQEIGKPIIFNAAFSESMFKQSLIFTPWIRNFSIDLVELCGGRAPIAPNGALSAVRGVSMGSEVRNGGKKKRRKYALCAIHMQAEQKPSSFYGYLRCCLHARLHAGRGGSLKSQRYHPSLMLPRT